MGRRGDRAPYRQDLVPNLQPPVLVGGTPFDDLRHIDAVVPRNVLVSYTPRDAEAKTWREESAEVGVRLPGEGWGQGTQRVGVDTERVTTFRPLDEFDLHELLSRGLPTHDVEPDDGARLLEGLHRRGVGHLPHIHFVHKQDAIVDPGGSEVGLSQERPVPPWPSLSREPAS